MNSNFETNADDLQGDWPATAYFLLQSIMGAAWWCGLFMSEDFRSLFLPATYPDSVLLSLVGADGVLFVAGSLLAAWIASGRVKLSPAFESIPILVLGATAYATLMCWGWVVSTNAAWASAICMTLALLGTSLAIRRIR